MTPSFHPFSFSGLSASPISDPCSTPETSHASSKWDAEHDQDDAQSYHTSTAHTHVPGSSYFSDGTDRDDDITTLEMPDGSTRLSSNWLPVDSSVGFTIGSTSSQGHYRNDPLDAVDLRDMQSAFFQNQFDSNAHT